MNPSSGRSLTVVLSVMILIIGVAIGGVPDSEKYAGTFDDLDVTAILKNDEERDKYYACFMDRGPCHTDAAVFFKSKAPEAVVTACRYCTDKQLEMFEKVVTWFVDNKPEDWNALIEKIVEDAKKMGLSP